LPERPAELFVPENLPVIADTFELWRYLVQRIEKFPRHHRHSLGLQIESKIQAIFGELLRCQHTAAVEQIGRQVGGWLRSLSKRPQS
jgi:hypothetical protein